MRIMIFRYLFLPKGFVPWTIIGGLSCFEEFHRINLGSKTICLQVVCWLGTQSIWMLLSMGLYMGTREVERGIDLGFLVLIIKWVWLKYNIYIMFMRIDENVCGKLIKRILLKLEIFEDFNSYKTINNEKKTV